MRFKIELTLNQVKTLEDYIEYLTSKLKASENRKILYQIQGKLQTAKEAV